MILEMIGERVLEGMGAAGYVIGLMAGVGAFLMLVGIVGYATLCVLGDGGSEEEEGYTNVGEDQQP